ncbi:MAG: glycosyltransferase [Oligoflexia bacterium]
MFGRSTQILSDVFVLMVLFGIYCTETLKLTFHGVSLRYSLLAIALLFVFKAARSVSTKRGLIPDSSVLILFLPFAVSSAISCIFSHDLKRATITWLWNCSTILLSFSFVRTATSRRLPALLLSALVAQSIVVIWDTLVINGVFPIGAAVGHLYPTYDTFRATAFYIAPQFFGGAISLSAFLYAVSASPPRSRAGALAEVVSLATIFLACFLIASRGALLQIAVISLGLLAAAVLATKRGVPTYWMRLGTPLIVAGSIWLLLGQTLTKKQTLALRDTFSLEQTWARACPAARNLLHISLECRKPNLGFPDGNVNLSSEGRRVAEWRSIAEDLADAPWFGRGYRGATADLTQKRFSAVLDENTNSKLIAYRYESLWGTILGYYGIAGVISLLIPFGVLALLIPSVGWICLAGFALIGAQSAQTLGRLDLWIPFFFFIELIRSRQKQQLQSTSILHVTARSDLGGGPKYISMILPRLISAGDLRQYYAGPRTQPFGETFFELCRDRGVDLPARKISPLHLMRFLIFIRSEHIGVVHSHGFGGGLYSRAAKLLGCYVIHQPHGLHAPATLKGRIKVLAEKSLAALTDQFIFVSPDESLQADRLFRPLAERSIIPNGIDTHEFKERLACEPIALRGSPRIGALSRLDPIKGHECLIRNFGMLVRVDPRFANARLYIAGDGEARPLVERAISLSPAKERIELLGTMDAARFLRSIDIFVACSLSEGLNLSVLEAALAGLPAVISKVPGHNFLISKGIARGFDLDDDRSFVDAVGQAISEPFSQDIPSRITDEFSIDRVVKDLRGIYSRAVSENSGHPDQGVHPVRSS